MVTKIRLLFAHQGNVDQHRDQLLSARFPSLRCTRNPVRVFVGLALSWQTQLYGKNLVQRPQRGNILSHFFLRDLHLSQTREAGAAV